MEYVLTARGLSKTYGSCHALHNLSMEVPKGAIYGLVGRNGAGKTTLIRLLCGLQAPTAGSYTLYGVEHSDGAIHTVRQRLGAVVEAACGKCTHVEVSDVAILARVLDGMGLSYTITSSHSADIYAHPHVTQLVQTLADAGCQVATMHQHDESLESYYMSLVGGDGHG